MDFQCFTGENDTEVMTLKSMFLLKFTLSSIGLSVILFEPY